MNKKEKNRKKEKYFKNKKPSRLCFNTTRNEI